MKPPLRHGLTLLELLVAIALTGVLAVSLAQWVSFAAGTSVHCNERADSVGPTLAFLQLIQDDLDAVAFSGSGIPQTSSRSTTHAVEMERVHIDENGTTLSITTRIPANQLPSSMTVSTDAIVRYRWDQSSATIARQYFTINGEMIQDTDRCVLAGVEKFECSVDDGPSPLLTLEVALQGDDAMKRSFCVQ